MPRSIRPKPGGGRLRWGDGARQRPAAPTPDADPLPEAVHEFLGLGLNPLVRAASPLLLLGGQLRGSTSPMDVEGLRSHALHEIRRFEDQARAAGVASEIVTAARYVLCAHLDEAVLSTPWGSQSEWAQHPLLVTLHREAWGGEKFFDMLDRVSTDPGKYINLLELQYLVSRPGLRRQVSGAATRVRAAGGDSAGALSHHQESPGHGAPGLVAALARPAGPPQPPGPLRAVVGGRCRGDRADRGVLHLLLLAARQPLVAGSCRAGEDWHRGFRPTGTHPCRARG